MAFDWALAFMMLVVSTLAAAGGLFAVAVFDPQSGRGQRSIFADKSGGTRFLFDGETLVDATPAARALIAQSPLRGPPWLRLRSYLGARFPDFEDRFTKLAEEGALALSSCDSNGAPILLRAELSGGLTRISLEDPEQQATLPIQDSLTRKATEDELAQLRNTLALAPMPVWRETTQGKLLWANAAYLHRVADGLPPGQDLSWPLPRLFEQDVAAVGTPLRHRLVQQGQQEKWFELHPYQDGADRLIFAFPVDTLVQAEASLRDFTQTLVKTFAHLPIGLAIFDRQRQLVLFNPALLDLSGLQPDFLSMRPTLFAFLDAMRERDMIPEPKDYRTWRRQMVALEEAASSGLFEETWSLPSGLTYKVVGRPHPNGALALLIEDISTEISRIRRYRADLELSQAVVDSVDQALAVFSPASVLVMANAAYCRLWGHDPASTLSEGSFAVLCAHWQRQSSPGTFWAEAEEFVAAHERDATALNGEARLLDGRLVECRISALPGGATLARFEVVTRVEDMQSALSTGRLRA